jgi:uncharacterized C2H2 Zn-finger protein
MVTRRSVLASVSAFFTALFAPRGKPCDIAVSDRDGDGYVDCPRRAAFAYDEAAMDAVTQAHGPRHFCEEHVGCATLPLVRVSTPNARAA